MKDTIFKMCIIVIGIAFLIIYFFHSQNGRFHKIEHGVIDTRTGIMYLRTEYGFSSINLKTGKAREYDEQLTNERKHPDVYYEAPKVEAPVAPAPAPEE